MNRRTRLPDSWLTDLAEVVAAARVRHPHAWVVVTLAAVAALVPTGSWLATIPALHLGALLRVRSADDVSAATLRAVTGTTAVLALLLLASGHSPFGTQYLSAGTGLVPAVIAIVGAWVCAPSRTSGPRAPALTLALLAGIALSWAHVKGPLHHGFGPALTPLGAVACGAFANTRRWRLAAGGLLLASAIWWLSWPIAVTWAASLFALANEAVLLVLGCVAVRAALAGGEREEQASTALAIRAQRSPALLASLLLLVAWVTVPIAQWRRAAESALGSAPYEPRVSSAQLPEWLLIWDASAVLLSGVALAAALGFHAARPGGDLLRGARVLAISLCVVTATASMTRWPLGSWDHAAPEVLRLVGLVTLAMLVGAVVTTLPRWRVTRSWIVFAALALAATGVLVIGVTESVVASFPSREGDGRLRPAGETWPPVDLGFTNREQAARLLAQLPALVLFHLIAARAHWCRLPLAAGAAVGAAAVALPLIPSRSFDLALAGAALGAAGGLLAMVALRGARRIGSLTAIADDHPARSVPATPPPPSG